MARSIALNQMTLLIGFSLKSTVFHLKKYDNVSALKRNSLPIVRQYSIVRPYSYEISK